MSTILLVEHDPLQAFLRKSILERRFSDVRRVGDAAEALCLLEQPQFAGGLGLVVSGSHHSGIAVEDFVAELHTRMPCLPVLVIGDDGDDSGDFAGDSVSFMPRPVIAEKLLTIASQLMAQDRRKTA